MYIVTQGRYFQDGCPLYVTSKKGIATKQCRKDGFILDRRYDLWCNEETEQWRRIKNIEEVFEECK